MRRLLWWLTVACACCALMGCARGGEGITAAQVLLDVYVQFAGPVDDSAHYYVAFNRDSGFGTRYPVPIANGPYWGNGWGTGSISHYVYYHLGQYNVYQANLTGVLRQTGGGVNGVSGSPAGADAGRYTLRVGTITHGEATVSGGGMVTSAANASGQNAGDIALQTDAAGQTVAGSVSFTPAADGGRPANQAELAQIAGLSAGGVALTAEALSAFGLTLTLGAAGAGTQTISIAPSVAAVAVSFVPFAGGAATNSAATLTANSSVPTATPPIAGATITTGELSAGEARCDVEISSTPVLLGRPYAYTLPSGSSALRFTLDIADLGDALTDLSFNVISTTELIFDPNVTDPDQHCYDGLGPLGDNAVAFSALEYRSHSNRDAFIPEGSNDTTLRGTVSEARKSAVDIIDWTVTLRRL